MVNNDSINHDHDDMSTCTSSTLSSTTVRFSGRFGCDSMSIHVIDRTTRIERSNNNNSSINLPISSSSSSSSSSSPSCVEDKNQISICLLLFSSPFGHVDHVVGKESSRNFSGHFKEIKRIK
mmetsp:Transcript_39205/g.44792  ORF Transcript_39205/g.44792 Transcript_39205/m.44792 type:complete len:122 (+) Transcript_39205:33-398(+)